MDKESLFMNSAQETVNTTQETENSPEQGVFARFEIKYFLPKQNAAFFKDTILKYMRPSHPIPGTKYTDVESVYFDSPDFWIYRTHFTSPQKRFKIRMRGYAPNGIPDGNAHLELKSKDADFSRKTRFQISDGDKWDLSNGGSVSHSLGMRSRNQNLTERQLEERVNQMNELILANGLRPSYVIRYQREAYERETLRVTIDDRISFEPVQSVSGLHSMFQTDPKLSELASNMNAEFRRGEYVILEIKHAGEVPGWVNETLKTADCKKAKFSKYCYCITETLLR